MELASALVRRWSVALMIGIGSVDGKSVASMKISIAPMVGSVDGVGIRQRQWLRQRYAVVFGLVLWDGWAGMVGSVGRCVLRGPGLGGTGCAPGVRRC